MIRLVEASYKGKLAGVEKNLYIVDEKGEVEIIELDKTNREGISKNMVVIKNVVDKYLQEGYHIISSTSLVPVITIEQYVVERTYLLQKID